MVLVLVSLLADAGCVPSTRGVVASSSVRSDGGMTCVCPDGVSESPERDLLMLGLRPDTRASWGAVPDGGYCEV